MSGEANYSFFIRSDKSVESFLGDAERLLALVAVPYGSNVNVDVASWLHQAYVDGRRSGCRDAAPKTEAWDRFAAAALTAVVRNCGPIDKANLSFEPEGIADMAADLADALLAERQKRVSP